MLSERAPAKINLALHVRKRRADGYHDIDTLFAFVEFGDTLQVEPADDLSLTIDGPLASRLGIDDNNLVLRAARLLQNAGDVRAGAHCALHKVIPVEAGLGGGSADAAATLRALNLLWGLNWPLARLAELGASLGADVPACVHGRTMRGTGVGEALVTLKDDDIAGAPVLLVNPGVAVPTGPVFRAWDSVDRGALSDMTPRAAALAGRNDLEKPACQIAPAIVTVLDALQALDGVQLGRMSGSGASCFALFRSEVQMQVAQSILRTLHPNWWSVATKFLSGT